ncbi:MAG: 3'-5' exoribonuclease [Alphaproteobacteria bacterium]|nr:3'-5' exoribonuclease [Alphaproteobacteria bacterium]
MTKDKPDGVMLRFFLDTEFDDENDDMRLDLISIGLVSEDGGREFYAECNAYDETRAHAWLQENVIPHLGPREQRLPVSSIREGLKKYFRAAVEGAEGRVTKVQIWSKNGSNDNTILGLIFGGLSKYYAFMNTLGVERTYFNDTDMLRRDLGDQKVKTERDPKHTAHHAMGDARHERREYGALQDAIKAKKAQPV